MKRFWQTLFFLVAAAPAFSQQRTFEIKNVSMYFDVKVSTSGCDEDSCTGKTTFSFIKKGGSTPYQVITLPETYLDLSRGGKPLVNTTMLYDEQSVINVGDFNFDGMDDVALCNGNYGSYGGPSYNIYLSSKAAGKFVYNPALTELASSNLGMFEVKKDKKLLETSNKGGCCLHTTERYKVVGNRPVKVWEEIEDATNYDGTNKPVKVTTRSLVNGRWKRSVKYVKRDS